MALNPAEISQIIKDRINDFKAVAEPRSEGTIVSVKDGIVLIYGLADVMYGEMIQFENGEYGLALNLERDVVGAVVLGNAENIVENQKVKCTGRMLEVPVGPGLLGRVVDALGNPIDGKGPIEFTEMAPIEKIAPGVIAREPVNQPLQSGLKVVDALVPVGRGQRELIIGDRQTGKSTVAIDTIINQKDLPAKNRPICVYVAVGQKQSKVAKIHANQFEA